MEELSPAMLRRNLKAQEPASLFPVYLKTGDSDGPFMGKGQVLPKEQSTLRKVPKIQFHDKQI